ncbi:MAG: T9SS type A sorting domain-containing protein [Candidatus Latescibacteria bacterium]|nr:T9SS type A sorting domain-containing protein [Candidatus Latescibacterota bacterium]
MFNAHWLHRAAFLLLGILAAPATSQPFFTEVTDQVAPPTDLSRTVTFGDYNNDGWPDLFLVQWGQSDFSGQLFLLTNQGNGHFDYNPTIWDFNPTTVGGGGSLFGDYDNDGDLDLFVAMGAWSAQSPNILLRNDLGHFTDITSAANLTDVRTTDNAIWLDYDQDGYLDLYISDMYDGALNSPPPTRNQLHRNEGDGTFSNVTQEVGLDLALNLCCGGSNGGMLASDLDGDTWPELYLGVFEGNNRLFRNDGQGHFADITTGELDDPGQAHGIAVGDINNDGDLDIFQTAGADNELEHRSLLLLNQGDGKFLDVTEGVGLIAARSTKAADLGDIDNDGDLDLVTGNPNFLFLNNGDGIFEDFTGQSGFGRTAIVVGLTDYDLDGCLDAVFGHGQSDNYQGPYGNLPAPIYRNNCNDNHWLKVELIGTESNRNGVGARVVAYSNGLAQTREIFGGLGYQQSEMIAHFGLGAIDRVDSLEIHWPSGRTSTLTTIAADQKIRLFEGRPGFHPVQPTRWTNNLPDSLRNGNVLQIDATVHPALFAAEAQITRVSADFSYLGGPSAIDLTDLGDQTYQLDFSFPVSSITNGRRPVSILIEQETPLGPYWTRLSKNIAVWPAADLPILTDALDTRWTVEGVKGIEAINLTHRDTVFQGSTAAAFQVRPESTVRPWEVSLSTSAPINPAFGYQTLRLALQLDQLQPSAFNTLFLKINERFLNLLGSEPVIDLQRSEWQIVEIPLADVPVLRLESIAILGNLTGTFYLDELTLSIDPPQANPTAVAENDIGTQPHTFDLAQNFPNPFNSGTNIPFHLPADGSVELAVFNLAGQRVATLLQGDHQAGHHTIAWDGRDDQGRPLASGLYLYRLQTDAARQTRKLLLLR